MMAWEALISLPAQFSLRNQKGEIDFLLAF